MTHVFELEVIRFIQQFRTPFLDYFFRSFDYFDRQEFLFVLIPIIWLCYGWKAGLRLFYVLLVSSLVNNALKEYFLSPRPFHLDPSLGIIQVKGLGFPSGAAQTVILLSGLLITSCKGSWKWAVAFSYILLVSFSRVYLGVHFPTDILGGWVVGFILLVIYLYVRLPLEKKLSRLRPGQLFLLSQLIPLCLIFTQPSIFMIRYGSVAMGIGVGLWVANCYNLILRLPKNRKEYVLRSLVGVLGLFSLYALSLLLLPSAAVVPSFMRFFTLGLWVSLGSLFVCRRLLA